MNYALDCVLTLIVDLAGCQPNKGINTGPLK